MPKVTLLAEEHQDRMIIFGKSQHTFLGGKSLTVSTAVALHCKKQKGADGSDLFEVTGLDKVVTAVPIKQNVGSLSRLDFTQLRLIEASLCH